MAHEHFPIVGIQWHPEAYTSPNGMVMIDNFLQKVARLIPGTPETTGELTERLISEIRETVGDKQVLTFVSGGVDSTVCLALLKKALKPEQIFPVFIDNWFMRQGEVEQVRKDLKDATWLDIHVIDAQEEFLNATTVIDGVRTPKLRDVTDPEVKRMIIGDAFMHVRDTVSARRKLRADFLLAQWTLSTDVKESGATDAGGNAKKIKTHHNRSQEVEKLLAEGRIIEPLVTQMKDGVRSIWKELWLWENMIVRNPFPGPGIAIRIICAAEPTTEDFEKLSPQIQEVIKNTWVQATLLPVKAVWVAWDERVYGNLLVLSGDKEPEWETLGKIRDDLTRINGICRVMYAFGKRVPETEIHEITPTYLSQDTANQVRQADKIVHDEFQRAGLLGYISQTPVASIPVGFAADWHRSIVIRPFKTVDFKTGDAIMPGTEHMPDAVLNTIISRITAEVPGISRVLYDITPKPPGTTELE